MSVPGSEEAGISGTVQQAATRAGEAVKVLSCTNCDGPVASSAAQCFACGTPVTGKEFAYVSRRPAGPNIVGMIKWWAVLSFLVFALGGFSFGIGSSIAFTVITLVYGIRVLRAYYL